MAQSAYHDASNLPASESLSLALRQYPSQCDASGSNRHGVMMPCRSPSPSPASLALSLHDLEDIEKGSSFGTATYHYPWQVTELLRNRDCICWPEAGRHFQAEFSRVLVAEFKPLRLAWAA